MPVLPKQAPHHLRLIGLCYPILQELTTNLKTGTFYPLAEDMMDRAGLVPITVMDFFPLFQQDGFYLMKHFLKVQNG